MRIAIDIIIVLIILFPAISGYRKGLFKSVFNIVSIVLSAAAAFFLKGSVGGFIRDRFVLGLVSNNVEGKLSSVLEKSNLDLTKLISSNNSEYNDLLKSYFASKTDIVSYTEKLNKTGDDAIRAVSERISYNIADKISMVIAFILVFVIVLIVLKLIIRLIAKVGNQTVFSGVNRLLGGLLGLILGAVLAVLFVYLLGLLIPVLSVSLPNIFYRNLLNDTTIGSFIYNLNILSLFNRA